MVTRQVRGEDWHCDAYGPRAVRTASSKMSSNRVATRSCTAMVTQERKRAWRVIQEGAAAGDPDMTYMAEHLTGPEQLLGGSE